MSRYYPTMTPPTFKIRTLAGDSPDPRAMVTEVDTEDGEELIERCDKSFVRTVESIFGQTLETMDEEKTMAALDEMTNSGEYSAKLASLLYSMIICQKSNTKAVLDVSKRTLRACTRLRELEARNKNRDAYESACSITITWPYKIPAKERSATLLSILKHQGYPTWHLDSMGHTDLDNRPTNRTIIRMSSKEVAEDLRWAINKNYYTPLNQWGEHTEGGGR